MAYARANKRLFQLSCHISRPAAVSDCLVPCANEKVTGVSLITAHILDTSVGRPAAGVTVRLYEFEKSTSQWTEKSPAGRVTNPDGRISDLLPVGSLSPGLYKLWFDTAGYFSKRPSLENGFFYPYVEVVFMIKETDKHYHIPLLLCPFGYSTYRGS